MSRWNAAFTRKGLLLQSSMPKGPPPPDPFRSGGRFFKGVVIKTYVYDSDGGAYTDPPPAQERPARRNIPSSITRTANEINGIYCDVLCYGRYKGIIPRVLVTQGPGGIHEGEVYRPRAVQIDVSGGELNPNLATNPADMDGDHVVVGFLEDDYFQPFISSYIPHPNRDKGNEGAAIGRRVLLEEDDREPRFIKHRGVVVGVDSTGNITIDATRGHDGAYNNLGKEPRLSTDPPRTEEGETDPVIPEDGSSGNITIKTQAKTTLEIDLNGQKITLTETDQKLVLDVENVELGKSATEAVALGDTLKSVLEALTVPTALGPSGTPLNAASFASFLSGKVKTT